MQTDGAPYERLHSTNAVVKLVRESGLRKPLVISSINCDKDEPIINARVCQEAILPIHFDKFTAMALLDTGADVNCIRYDFVDTLRMTDKIRPVDPDNKFVSASNDDFAPTGEVTIEFSSSKGQHAIRCFVFKNLLHPVILGLPFMYKYKVKLDFSRRRHREFNGSFPATAAQSVTLAAGQAALIPITLDAPYDIPTGLQGYIKGQKRRSGLKTLDTASTVVDNTCVLTVYNKSESFLNIPQGMTLGHFKSITDADLFESKPAELRAHAGRIGINRIGVASHGTKLPEAKQKADSGITIPQVTPTSKEAREFLQDEYQFNFEGINLPQSQKQQLQEVLFNNCRTFVDSTGKLGYNDSVYHTIDVPPGVEPVRKQPYRMPPAVKEQLRKQIDYLVQQEVLKEELSEWALPVLAVKKGAKKSQKHLKKNKNAEYRLVVDFRQLNAKIQIKQAALCSIQDLLDEIGASKPKYFTVLDLKHGYFQMAIDPKSRKYTGFIFDKKSYVHVTSPMGLKSSPFQFQQLMFKVLAKLLSTGKVFCYLDDLLIVAETWDEHISLLKQVLEALKEANLKLGAAKCVFAAKRIEYLGFTLNSEGYMPSDKHVEALRTYPVPRTVAQLKTFMGLANYFCNFLPRRPTLLAPLLRLMKKDAKFQWDDECQKSFEMVVETLTTQPVLAYADFSREFVLVTDASSHGIGGVLLQPDDNGVNKPIAFAGRKTNKHEQNYNTTELEALAIVFCVKKWHYYLATNHFKIYTDHSALKVLTGKTQYNPKLTRYAEFLGNYSFDLFHIKGVHNSAADALSRRAYPSQGKPNASDNESTIRTGNQDANAEVCFLKEKYSEIPLHYNGKSLNFMLPPVLRPATDLVVLEQNNMLSNKDQLVLDTESAAGNELKRFKRKLMKSSGHFRPGDCILAPAGALDTQHLCYLVLPHKTAETQERDVRMVLRAYEHLFELIRTNKYRQVVFPLVCAGSNGFTFAQALSLFTRALIPVLKQADPLTLFVYVPSPELQHKAHSHMASILAKLPQSIHKLLRIETTIWQDNLGPLPSDLISQPEIPQTSPAPASQDALEIIAQQARVSRLSADASGTADHSDASRELNQTPCGEMPPTTNEALSGKEIGSSCCALAPKEKPSVNLNSPMDQTSASIETKMQEVIVSDLKPALQPVTTRQQAKQDEQLNIRPKPPTLAQNASNKPVSDTPKITTDMIITQQLKDEFLGDIYQYITRGILPESTQRKRKVFSREDRYTVKENVLFFIEENTLTHETTLRIALPSALIEPYIRALHCSDVGAHLGIDKTYAMLRARVHFRGMYRAVQNIINSCDVCGLTKPRNRAIVSQPAAYELAEQPFERMHVDHATFDFTTTHNRYVATCVDAMSGYIIAWPCRTLTAEELARGFYINVTLRFGSPKKLVSDNATNFKASLWTEVAQLLGVTLTYSKPYTSRTNGMAERSVRSLRQTLSSLQLQTKLEWDYNLPSVIFALNNTPNRHSGISPHQIIFGKSARLPIDNIVNNGKDPMSFNEVVQNIWKAQNLAQEKCLQLKEKQDHASLQSRPRQKNVADIFPGRVVYWHKPNLNAGPGTLAAKYYGPYKVLDCNEHGASLQHIDTGDKPNSKVNLEHLKPVEICEEYFGRPHFSQDEVYRSRRNKLVPSNNKNQAPHSNQ